VYDEFVARVTKKVRATASIHVPRHAAPGWVLKMLYGRGKRD